MKQAIYFIEATDGKRYYKTDTFWSRSLDVTHAKIHDDSDHDQVRLFNSLCVSFRPWKSENLEDEIYESFKKYEGGKYGFMTFVVSDSSKYTVSEDIKLSNPNYLKVIDRISQDGIIDFTDYKVIDRDIKITKLTEEE